MAISDSAFIDQRQIQNPLEHLRWSFWRKYLTARNYFVKSSTYKFDWVLNTPLLIAVIYNTIATEVTELRLIYDNGG